MTLEIICIILSVFGHYPLDITVLSSLPGTSGKLLSFLSRAVSLPNLKDCLSGSYFRLLCILIWNQSFTLYPHILWIRAVFSASKPRSTLESPFSFIFYLKEHCLSAVHDYLYIGLTFFIYLRYLRNSEKLFPQILWTLIITIPFYDKFRV